jgi:hypothetical protein
MAESKNNVITHGLSGKIDLLVFRQRNGKTLVSKAPKEITQTSLAQEQVKQRFQQAVIYAKAAIANATTKEAYDSKAEAGQSAYNVAIADFFNAPDIQAIDVSAYTGAVGSKIGIKVTDDFKVEQVYVQIVNADGTLVEQGNAVADANGLDWLYTATINNASLTGDKIIVTATDKPGNDTNLEKTLA